MGINTTADIYTRSAYKVDYNFVAKLDVYYKRQGCEISKIGI